MGKTLIITEDRFKIIYMSTKEEMVHTYKNAEELVLNELPRDIRKCIFPIVQLGSIVYQDILSIQSDTFKSQYFDGVYSRLMTACIYTQFEPDMLSINFPFKCSKLRTNSFGHYIPELHRGNIIIHLEAASKENSLPSVSGYKKKYARYNCFEKRQLVLKGCRKNCPPKIEGEPYYGIITYGGKKELQFLSLLIPSYDFEEILYSIDLKEDLLLASHDPDTEEYIKRGRVRLRENILAKLKEDETVSQFGNLESMD